MHFGNAMKPNIMDKSYWLRRALSESTIDYLRKIILRAPVEAQLSTSGCQVCRRRDINRYSTNVWMMDGVSLREFHVQFIGNATTDSSHEVANLEPVAYNTSNKIEKKKKKTRQNIQTLFTK